MTPAEHVTVIKFGGGCFESTEDYERAAGTILRLAGDTGRVVAVVSAMRDCTALLQNALNSVNYHAPPQIAAHLLTTGDLQSAALLAAAVAATGMRTALLPPHQAGLVGTGSPLRARLRSWDGAHLRAVAGTHRVVVLPGGQAVDEEGTVVMLGRNSSDLSAVCAAVAVGSPTCRIASNVPGIYTADPAIVPEARLIDSLDYQTVLEIGRSGARVLHPQAVRLARDNRIRIECTGRPPVETPGTRIEPEATNTTPLVVAAAGSEVWRVPGAIEMQRIAEELSQESIESCTMLSGQDSYVVVANGFYRATTDRICGGRGVLTGLRMLSVVSPGNEPVRHLVPAELLASRARDHHAVASGGGRRPRSPRGPAAVSGSAPLPRARTRSRGTAAAGVPVSGGERYAVLVDGYHLRDGDNRGFSSAFQARGITPVTVMSTPEPLAKFVRKSTWYPDDFAAVHYYDGDFPALCELVRGYDPVCIIAENERGVELAADLVEELLPGTGNVPGSALAQRNKGEMAAALERAGIPGPATLSTDSLDEAHRWMRANGLADRPVIIKPPSSAGTENVHLIADPADFDTYFTTVLGATNGFEQRNDTVIVQEFLDGEEYIIDLYSVDGRHGVVDACVYTKHNRGARIGIYDTADFLAPDHPDLAELVEYTKDCADAVGIRNGSTHAEVIRTASGPRLVELAARYSGSCMMLSGSYATGDNQIERTVRHVLDGHFEPGFRLERQVRTLWLCADQAGPVRHMDILRAAAELPTVYKMSVPEDGKDMPMTNDVTTSLGWIILGAEDWPAIEEDYRRIRELEREWNAAQSDEHAVQRR